MKYAYYPGCAATGSTPELDIATRRVAGKLGVELVELKEAGCCGAKEIGVVSPKLNFVLNARILALAERMGADILTVCNTCLLNLLQAKNRLKEDPKLYEETNKAISKMGLKYSGTVKVKHLLWATIDDIGLDTLKISVTNPLSKMKIAPFYGCHILRPGKELGFEDSENPTSLERIIQTLGGDPIEFTGKTKCCGFYTLMTNEKLSLGMIGLRIQEAKDAGADCMVTPCPLCHIALDMYQSKSEKHLKTKLNMPVFHLPQLMGLAMGMTASELQLSKHFVRTDKVLCKMCSP